MCNGARKVSHLLAQTDTRQPSMSQHLATLCRALCTQVATDLDGEHKVPPAERLAHAVRR